MDTKIHKNNQYCAGPQCDCGYKSTQHTPGPWNSDTHINPRNVYAGDLIVAVCQYVDGTDAEVNANAAFIVRAVNSHDELVGLLQHCREYLGGYAEKPDMAVIAKALAKATGGK